MLAVPRDSLSTLLVETEFVVSDVLRDDARLVDAIGRQETYPFRAERQQSCAFGLECGQAFVAYEPGPDADVEVHPILDDLAFRDVLEEECRGPAPDGSTHAKTDPCCPVGSERSKSSQVAKPSGGGRTTYPNTSHQKRATRCGSAQSKVTWTFLTVATGPE